MDLKNIHARQKQRRAEQNGTAFADRYVETSRGALLNEAGVPINFPYNKHNPHTPLSMYQTEQYNRACRVTALIDSGFVARLYADNPGYYRTLTTLTPIMEGAMSQSQYISVTEFSYPTIFKTFESIQLDSGGGGSDTDSHSCFRVPCCFADQLPTLERKLASLTDEQREELCNGERAAASAFAQQHDMEDVDRFLDMFFDCWTSTPDNA